MAASRRVRNNLTVSGSIHIDALNQNGPIREKGFTNVGDSDNTATQFSYNVNDNDYFLDVTQTAITTNGVDIFLPFYGSGRQIGRIIKLWVSDGTLSGTNDVQTYVYTTSDEDISNTAALGDPLDSGNPYREYICTGSNWVELPISSNSVDIVAPP